MFKINGKVHIDVTDIDEKKKNVVIDETVTWDNGKFDKPAFHEFMEEKIRYLREKGTKTVTVMMQTVPLDLKHELCAWWICDDFFDVMTLLDGGLDTLEPTPEGEVS